jgi:hypothetical protein
MWNKFPTLLESSKKAKIFVKIIVLGHALEGKQIVQRIRRNFFFEFVLSRKKPSYAEHFDLDNCCTVHEKLGQWMNYIDGQNAEGINSI